MIEKEKNKNEKENNKDIDDYKLFLNEVGKTKEVRKKILRPGSIFPIHTRN